MRLWHQELIPRLPRNQLLGQHRECAALRGGGWGKPHRTVNYVFEYPWTFLYFYHVLIMDEMERRGFQVDPLWRTPIYRGKTWPAWPKDQAPRELMTEFPLIYPEHDEAYLQECLDNLKGKGIDLSLE
ncbi:TIGR02328 family protein [Gorillibacterium sp. CAU 1737]|uniref:TIGR02328 family protein n=1 Tax=Gorillibacterium sp. CAU 1737 TaxID=3140362 RepID=UPI0032615CEF